MNIIGHNQAVWNIKVENGSVYTKPVDRETIERSKRGEWEITVTIKKPVPRDWFPSSIAGLNILCLASGGGQQGPILSAAGAEVTVFDLSEKQLLQDEFVARRDGLTLKTVQGSMTDLSCFENSCFDMIVHPVSNVFIENVLPVWRETARVIKSKGILISGFVNPLLYIFDEEQENKGVLDVQHPIPYSTVLHLTEEERRRHMEKGQALEFGHTLEDQIQGQLDAGYVIAGFYEDDFGGDRLLDNYIKSFMATRAVRIG